MTEDYKKIIISGEIYIKYYDEPENPNKGDIRLFMHDDAKTTFLGDYQNSSYSGYFKGEVFDGKYWQLINLEEFLDNKEYKYAKKQKPLDTGILCQQLLSNVSGVEIYRTYRGHFTREEYIPEIRITKANRKRK